MGNRLTITINLVNGKDDDLIQWVSQLERGQRESMLKAALRHALVTVGEIEVHRNGNGNGLDKRVSELEAMVSYLTSRIESGTFFYDIASQEPQVEAMPQLSKDEVQQRAAKLKKAKW